MIELQWLLAFLALGVFVGVIAGLLGVGGGGFMVPILTTIFIEQGVPMDRVVHLALGTTMASIVFTSLSSMRAHNAKNAVNWKLVKGISGGIVLGVFSAAFIASYISSVGLTIFFSFFMACVSVQMFMDKKPKPDKRISGNHELFVVGTGIGAISALVSIGGGTLTVPYLVWKNVDIKQAIGTSAAVGLPISIAGTLAYILSGWSNTSIESYTFGNIYFPAVVLISITSFFCAPLGVKLGHFLPVPQLKKLFSVLLIALSIKMIMTIL